MSKYFYSCDWGTTNLRLRLVQASTNIVVSGIETDQGISKIFSQWKQSDMDRFRFYCDILHSCISKLNPSIETSSESLPVIVSGMALSNMGMIELPYTELPVKLDGTGILIQTFQSSGDFTHPLMLISGVRTNTDFMRGEEVQVIGACRSDSDNEELFILPGTHSKHVWTHNNNVTDLKTYMTGELFQLLSINSILSNSIETTENSDIPDWEIFFEEGVLQSVKNGVLENLFGLRVAHTFNKRTARQNRHYLNGLLIGSELKNISQNHNSEIVLVSNELQKKYYSAALDVLKVSVNRRCVSSEIATITGHSLLFQKHADGLIYK